MTPEEKEAHKVYMKALKQYTGEKVCGIVKKVNQWKKLRDANGKVVKDSQNRELYTYTHKNVYHKVTDRQLDYIKDYLEQNPINATYDTKHVSMLRNTNLTTEHRVRLIYNKLALNYRKYPRIGIYAQTGVNPDGSTTGFSTKLGNLEFAIE